MLRDNILNKYSFRTVNGIIYFYDAARMKWLSIQKSYLSFGINHKNINSSRWLAIQGVIYSNNLGFSMPDNGTITRAITQSKVNTQCNFNIFEDNSIITTVSLTNETEKIHTLDIDYSINSQLRAYLEIITKADYPFIVLECASRI